MKCVVRHFAPRRCQSLLVLRRKCFGASTRARSGTMKSGMFLGTTEDELKVWLQERGINTAGFGSISGTKTLRDLHTEICNGESVLITGEDGSPMRMVAVISVNITNRKGLSLYEAKQRLPSGKLRERNLLLSEKLLPHETWIEAGRRGILEELGSVLPSHPEIDILSDTYSMNTEKSMSGSYPGLLTEYTCHKVQANVMGLPETDFTTEEQRPDGVLISEWSWR
jgi:hypothetical protein